MMAQPTSTDALVSPRPRLARVAAIVNPLSQSVGANDAEALEAIVAEFGLPLHLACPEPKEIESAIRAAIDSQPDLLLVLAGDGTAREAARLCGPDGPAVAILPGGTLNVLSQALYGVRPWRDSLRTILETGEDRALSGGDISGRPFYVAAILGSPALWAPVREAARAMHLRSALRRGRYALARAFAGHLRFESDAQRASKTTGLGLICPLISRVFDDDVPAIEAALLDQHNIADVLRLGIYNLMGDWRRDPSVVTAPCQNGRAWGRRPIPAILDGESFLLERAVDITFVPKAYHALVPPRAS